MPGPSPSKPQRSSAKGVWCAWFSRCREQFCEAHLFPFTGVVNVERRTAGQTASKRFSAVNTLKPLRHYAAERQRYPSCGQGLSLRSVACSFRLLESGYGRRQTRPDWPGEFLFGAVLIILDE